MRSQTLKVNKTKMEVSKGSLMWSYLLVNQCSDKQKLHARYVMRWMHELPRNQYRINVGLIVRWVKSSCRTLIQAKYSWPGRKILFFMKMFYSGPSTRRKKYLGIYWNLLMICIVSADSKSNKTAKNSRPFAVGKFLATSIHYNISFTTARL